MNDVKNRMLAFTVAQMAHDANLVWGLAKDCVVDARNWYQLTHQEKNKKADIMLECGNADAMTHEQQHENWLKTAPKDHPCNVSYESLGVVQKAKDLIFSSHIKLYKDLCATLDIEEV